MNPEDMMGMQEPAQPGIDNTQEGPQAAVAQMGGQQFAAPPPDAPMNPPPVDVGESPESADPMAKLRGIMEEINLAEDLDEDLVNQIGMECKNGFEEDCNSRQGWEEDVKEWLALATQERDLKSWPWPNASNVKYPLMGIAAMQFSARAYPSLVPANGNLVQAKVFGKDPTGVKNARATRVSEYMSYQLAVEMPYWEEEMDALLMQLSVVGMMYKKTYWDAEKEIITSKAVSATDLVVNYWTKNLEEAERISHRMWMYERNVKNLQRAGYFLDVDLGEPQESIDETIFLPDENISGGHGKIIPFEIIECHTWLSLDDDDTIEMPYVVTFERSSGKVLRIVGRFDLGKVKTGEKGEVVYVEPIHYFTKFGFIPNPNGSFYDLGFGHLLGPLNEAANTITNQLTDAGTLNNLQSGFIGRGLKVRGGNYNFEPGEWKWVNGVVDDMKKQILPLPTKEPSQTLFKLLEMLISSGKELASVAEIFVGKMPGQNTPATTTMASIEQGMKVFTAIYKRVYRSLGKEYSKIFRLNQTYINPQTMSAVLEEPIGPGDFNDSIMHILPSADPSASSQQENLAKAQALVELLPLGTLDPMEVTIRMLKATEQPSWEKLIPGMAQTGQPQPKQEQPDPKQIAMQQKAESDKQKATQQSQMMAEKHALEQQSEQGKVAMEQQSMAQKQAHEQNMGDIKEENERRKQAIFAAQKKEKAKKE